MFISDYKAAPTSAKLTPSSFTTTTVHSSPEQSLYGSTCPHSIASKPIPIKPPIPPKSSPSPSSKMCGWEEIIYTCDRRHSKLRRTKYSCDVYRRYVYGFCEFDERYDRRRVSQYHSSGMCDECNAIFQYVNFD